MKVGKHFITFCALAFLISPTAYALTCSEQFSQEMLDAQYSEIFNPDEFIYSDDNSRAVSETPTKCKYIDSRDATSQKVFKLFTFIEEDKYILYSCEYSKFVEIVASPKYLSSHLEVVDGKCEPEFNPLSLRSYSIEFSNLNGEFVKLRRMVE